MMYADTPPCDGYAPGYPSRCRCGSRVAQWERLHHLKPLRPGCREWLDANDANRRDR